MIENNLSPFNFLIPRPTDVLAIAFPSWRLRKNQNTHISRTRTATIVEDMALGEKTDGLYVAPTGSKMRRGICFRLFHVVRVVLQG